jgi:hypothetical protein
MFRIEMLPAREGDCLWITYGEEAAPCHILIDGGRGGTCEEILAKVDGLEGATADFELFIITHVDRDHIEGALKLLEDEDAPVTYRDIWFNGFDHLKAPDVEPFGAKQGEKLTDVLIDRSFSWNRDFQKRAAFAPDGSSLPKVCLPRSWGISSPSGRRSARRLASPRASRPKTRRPRGSRASPPSTSTNSPRRSSIPTTPSQTARASLFSRSTRASALSWPGTPM